MNLLILALILACCAIPWFAYWGWCHARNYYEPRAELCRARNERLISGLRGVLTGLPGFTLRGVLDKYYADMRDETEAK